MQSKLLTLLISFLFSLFKAESFTTTSFHTLKSNSLLFRTTHIKNTSTAIKDTMNDSKPDPSTMKIKEIKDELTEMNISFAGCFDKESLIERLKDARSGKVIGTQTSTSAQKTPEKRSTTSHSTSKSSFDKDKVLMDLRSKTIKELRTMCAQAGIRWATMIEKEDYVKALLALEEQRGDFSPSGKLTPGKVGNIGQDDVGKELKGRADTPLLLDVYAVSL
jgi:hypothetical protein